MGKLTKNKNIFFLTLAILFILIPGICLPQKICFRSLIMFDACGICIKDEAPLSAGSDSECCHSFLSDSDSSPSDCLWNETTHSILGTPLFKIGKVELTVVISIIQTVQSESQTGNLFPSPPEKIYAANSSLLEKNCIL